MSPFKKRLIIGLGLMALLSPLGIIIPRAFDSTGAWGEWSTETLQTLLGYIPEGLKKYADLWKAPIPDYSFGGEKAPLAIQILSYALSAIIGIAVVGLVVFLISRILIRHDK